MTSAMSCDAIYCRMAARIEVLELRHGAWVIAGYYCYSHANEMVRDSKIKLGADL